MWDSTPSIHGITAAAGTKKPKKYTKIALRLLKFSCLFHYFLDRLSVEKTIFSLFQTEEIVFSCSQSYADDFRRGGFAQEGIVEAGSSDTWNGRLMMRITCHCLCYCCRCCFVFVFVVIVCDLLVILTCEKNLYQHQSHLIPLMFGSKLTKRGFNTHNHP